MFTSNVDNGALEAMIFGLRDSLFDEDDYNTLSQCETISDAQTFLSASDYSFFLEGQEKASENGTLSALQEKIVREFAYFRSNATSDLAAFLDYVAEAYQLDNVLKIIAGKRTNSAFDNLTKCHPLGHIPVMSALTSASDVSEMLDILSETSSLQKYFSRDMAIDFEKMPIEYIRALVQKSWLENFHRFCTLIGGETSEVMQEILSFESDREVLTLTLNTMGSAMGPDMNEQWRRNLYPDVGSLAPVYSALAQARSTHDLTECLRGYPEYAEMISSINGYTSASKQRHGSSSFESNIRRKALTVYRDAFHRQFHFGLFYAYIRLKSIEVENIHWTIECIKQDMRSHIAGFLTV